MRNAWKQNLKQGDTAASKDISSFVSIYFSRSVLFFHAFFQCLVWTNFTDQIHLEIAENRQPTR